MENLLFIFGAGLLALNLVYGNGLKKNWLVGKAAFLSASFVFGALAGVFLVFVARVFRGLEDGSVAAIVVGGIACGSAALVAAYLRRRDEPGVRKSLMWQKDWLETGWSSVLLAAFIMYFFVQAFRIPSASMRDTFLEGDHLFVNKFIYGFRVPLSGGKRILPLKKVARGDIVIFEAPPGALSPVEREKKIKKDFIKRCVAAGGDWVEVKDKKLYVNGVLCDEQYTRFADSGLPVYPKSPRHRAMNTQEYQRLWESGDFADEHGGVRDNFGPVMVPPGHYFCMGDNRDRSHDSRFWGPLADKYLKGRSWFIYWPLSRLKVVMK